VLGYDFASQQRLSELVVPAVRITRAVPLPSAAKRLSPTAIYPADPVAFELFDAVGTVFPVERENEFDAICATTATIASYFAFNETNASWLERQSVPASQARDYIARLFLGGNDWRCRNARAQFPITGRYSHYRWRHK
jgi:pyrroline-5-carboxylate reductase